MARATSKRKVVDTKKYKDIISYYGKIEFYKNFINELNSNLLKYTNEKEAQVILGLLKNKTLSIVNTEAFFDETNIISDLSMKSFNTSKTLKEYMYKLLFNIKQELNKGVSNIVLTDFVLNLSFFIMKSKEEGYIPEIKTLLEFFFLSLASEGNNPITIRILDGKAYRVAIKKYVDYVAKCNTSGIPHIVNAIYNALKNFKEVAPEGFSPPNIEIIRSIYSNVRKNQILYLQENFYMLPRSEINSAVKDIKDLSENSSKLEVALEYLISMAGDNVKRNIKSIILELQRIAKGGQKKTFKYRAELQDMFKNAGVGIQEAYDAGFKEIFIDHETFKESHIPVFSEIKVDCMGKNFKEIKILIKYADTLNLLKKRNFPKSTLNSVYKITLFNVEFVQENIAKFLKNIKETLESEKVHNIVFEVQYEEMSARSSAGMDKPKYIRIISDMHSDINAKKKYTFNFDNDFIVNCGDTSGDSRTTINWVRNYMRRGVFTYGNHLGYEQPYPQLNSSDNEEVWNNFIHKSNTCNMQVKEIGTELVGSEDVYFLADSYYEYEGIIFIGSCLHTDFCLYGEDKQDSCMRFAKNGMNDFVYKYIYAESKKEILEPHLLKTHYCGKHVRKIEPVDYLNYFLKSVLYIEKTIKKFPTKPIVLFTHFAPLPFFVSKQYKNDPLSASFASDLRWLIKKYPNIRLVACGHTHDKFDFIYEGVRCICNPFGYYNENDAKLPNNYGTRVLIKDIKSKQPWPTLLVKEILDQKIKIVKDKDWFIPVQKFIPSRNIRELSQQKQS